MADRASKNIVKRTQQPMSVLALQPTKEIIQLEIYGNRI